MDKLLSPRAKILKAFCLSLFLFTVIIVQFLATLSFNDSAEAAQLNIDQSNYTTDLKQGEHKLIPFTFSMADTSMPDWFVTFQLVQVDGNLPRNWLSQTVQYVTIISSRANTQTSISINVPQDAPQGIYAAKFKTFVIRSNERFIRPLLMTLTLNIKEQLACKQTPLFSDIETSQGVINTRNKKSVTIDFSGSILSPEGCQTDNAWFEFSDEYGELDEVRQIEFNEAGEFAIEVPMIAYRKGADSDGRLYTITFMATNEVGLGKSEETYITVSHDNRK